MKRLTCAALGAVGAMALLASAASAAVVCNEDGDCWRVKEKHTYPPDVRVQIYEDDFDITTRKYRWRDAGPGRGYWRGGVWVDF
jgi:hypothetical protein